MGGSRIGNITVVALAGGKSSRFGTDKSLLRLDNMLMLEHSLARWRDLFGEVIVVCSAGKSLGIPGTREAEDIYPEKGPLGGIHTGLSNCVSDWAFVIACDMPGVTRKFAELLLNEADRLDPEARVLVPRHGKYREPLCALYHREIAGIAEEMLKEEGGHAVAELYKRVPVRYFEAEDCFFNVNRPEDYAQLTKDSLLTENEKDAMRKGGADNKQNGVAKTNS